MTYWSTIAKHAVVLTVSASRMMNEFKTDYPTKGKGYPDIATRAMLSRLASSGHPAGKPTTPIYCLVDFDPDGLAILSTYKYGSAALAHENDTLIVPELRWLGLKHNDISHMQVDVHYQALMPLSLRDRQKARSMLTWRHVCVDEGDLEMRQALQVMLVLNLKAEIQVLDAMSGGLEEWLQSALETA